MKSSSWIYSILFLLLLIGFRLGCPTQSKNVAEKLPPDNDPQVNTNRDWQTNQQPAVVSHSPSTVIIGSFNIQVFGVTKSTNQFAMERLVDIARRYDLLAIQEIRSNDQSVLESYVRQINADGSQFSYIIGPRQGRSNSKEQYAYIFDTAKFRLTSQPYVAHDPTGMLHRPPLIASFQSTQAPDGEGFSFTVLNLHIDPDDVDAEFQTLERIMPQIFQNHPHEDDYIVMGDFNDSGNKFKHYRWLANQFPLIRSNWTTKVRSGRSIDNIVIDGMRTEEYRNQSGVLNFTQQYQLSIQDSLQISDHYPVWAVFSTVEAQPRFASNR